MRIKFLILFFAGILVLAAGAQGAGFYTQSYSSSVNYQATRPGFQSYYSGSEISMYWPILSEMDKGTCEGRQDLILQVVPAGCQPAVVRSDLLAEQNVPVFCQISSMKINPLIDVKNIKNIRFKGNYPKEVAGVGFHPARAALRTRSTLLGSPLDNNVGYVVVVLKRNEKEKELPDFVTVNLSAQIDYDAGNALGVGRTEFLLEKYDDREWEQEKTRSTFWKGRYALRLEDMSPDYATVSIYQEDRKMLTTKLKKGEMSKDLPLAGFYCTAELQAEYMGSELARDKARIEVSDQDTTQQIDVYKGSKFLNDKCSVDDIRVGIDGETGELLLSCAGSKFSLSFNSLVSQALQIFRNASGFKEPVEISGSYEFDFGTQRDQNLLERGKGVYALRLNDNVLLKKNATGWLDVKSSGIYAKADASTKTWIDSVERGFSEYKRLKAEGGGKVGMVSDKSYDAEAEKAFKDAIEEYEKVAKDYPSEKRDNVNVSFSYGEQALIEAIELAAYYGKGSEEVRLINKFVAAYPNSPQVAEYKLRLERARKLDTSKSGYSIEVDNEYRVIRLISFSPARERASAEFRIGNVKTVKLAEGENYSFGKMAFESEAAQDRYIRVLKVGTNEVELTTNCKRERGGIGGRVTLRTDSIEQSHELLCNEEVKLDRVDVKEVAKVILYPKMRTEGETNLTVKIGIEKRAIQLNPEKTAEKIARLNETIKKWESISNSLGNVVSGLKGACFATAATLTIKNFMTGLSGEALARTQVMSGDKGWTMRCKNQLESGIGGYVSMDDCLRKNADAIDKDVKATADTMAQVNAKAKGFEEGFVQGGLLGDKTLTSDVPRQRMLNELKTQFPNEPAVQQLTDQTSYSEMRDLYFNLMLKKQGGLSAGSMDNVNNRINMSYERLKEVKDFQNMQSAAAKLEGQGIPRATSLVPGGAVVRTQVLSRESVKVNGLQKGQTGYLSDKATNVASVIVGAKTVGKGKDQKTFEAGQYMIGLEKVGKDSNRPIDAVRVDANGNPVGQRITGENLSAFASAYSIGSVEGIDASSYFNPIKNPQVRYYETEPYKGLPAIVPFDVERGWYAATRQTLPAFGGIGAFDASGRIVSFSVCNVGKNGRIEFDSLEDDICEGINLNTGMPYNVFPGLSEQQAKDLVNRARSALEEASRQYGKGKLVNIGGKQYEVGNPMANVPQTRCQDFMSPKDCLLMFNVCDPVICPASRCDLGGKYPVTDVVQTGIIGSIALCLPNFREGIAIPVCLTGVKAGIDAYLSIMKSYRDCLQENLNTGRMVGICDQIYSVYLCEFFWRQIAPVANIIIPKLIETAYGQGVRGGGEYMTVMGAWDNMKNSVNYFTQSYGVNAMKAFQARSLEEAGGEFCKAYISMAGPKSLKTLLEPDSPPQFYASFSSTTYTTATVPATAQYKVFYHIFAGNDMGVYYNVYLKSPPETSYYQQTPFVQVASGFVTKGQYASETKDFTAPEGYKELCVRINDKEECGFKQVSTDFAVNYLRDKYVSDEMKRTDIKSEQECISGSPGLGPIVANTNLQAMAEEAAMPQIYNRGVVRICATDNPGKSTDPGRFVPVGNCGNEKLTCWLDKTSVNNAITDANKGVKNETLQALEGIYQDYLQNSGIVMKTQDAANAIGELEKRKNELRTLGADRLSEIKSSANVLLGNATRLLDSVIMNNQRAWIYLIRAEVLGHVAGVMKDKYDADHKVVDKCGNNVIDSANGEECDGSDFGTASCAAGEPGEITCFNCKYDRSTCTSTSIRVKLELSYSETEPNGFLLDGNSVSGIQREGDTIYLSEGQAEVGKIVNNRGALEIRMDQTKVENIDTLVEGVSLFTLLNEGRIRNRNVVSKVAGAVPAAVTPTVTAAAGLTLDRSYDEEPTPINILLDGNPLGIIIDVPESDGIRYVKVLSSGEKIGNLYVNNRKQKVIVLYEDMKSEAEGVREGLFDMLNWRIIDGDKLVPGPQTLTPQSALALSEPYDKGKTLITVVLNGINTDVSIQSGGIYIKGILKSVGYVNNENRIIFDQLPSYYNIVQLGVSNRISPELYHSLNNGIIKGSEIVITDTEWCGNNIVGTSTSTSQLEDCDGAIPEGKDCTNIGRPEFAGGTLKCYPPGHTSECRFDTGGCTLSSEPFVVERYKDTGIYELYYVVGGTDKMNTGIRFFENISLVGERDRYIGSLDKSFNPFNTNDEPDIYVISVKPEVKGENVIGEYNGITQKLFNFSKLDKANLFVYKEGKIVLSLTPEGSEPVKPTQETMKPAATPQPAATAAPVQNVYFVTPKNSNTDTYFRFYDGGWQWSVDKQYWASVSTDTMSGGRYDGAKQNQGEITLSKILQYRNREDSGVSTLKTQTYFYTLSGGKWTLQNALAEVRTYSGSYTKNKEFIDGLHTDGIITDAEYTDINGDGMFNLEEDMSYVVNLLAKKTSGQ